MKNQFTFAAGVTGINDDVDLLFLGKRQHVLEATGALLDRLQFELFWNCWQDVEIPRQVFAVWAGWHLQLDEVTDSGRDGGVFVFKILGIAGFSFLLELAECLGKCT